MIITEPRHLRRYRRNSVCRVGFLRQYDGADHSDGRKLLSPDREDGEEGSSAATNGPGT